MIFDLLLNKEIMTPFLQYDLSFINIKYIVLYKGEVLVKRFDKHHQNLIIKADQVKKKQLNVDKVISNLFQCYVLKIVIYTYVPLSVTLLILRYEDKLILFRAA